MGSPRATDSVKLQDLVHVCVQTWYVCCAEEAFLCVSWWAFSSRFTSRGIVPASLSGAWLVGHSARFRIRPTVAWGEDRDQRRFSVTVSFKGNVTCGASIWHYQPPLELSADCMHWTHVYQAVCVWCFISKETTGMRGKRSNSFLWMGRSLTDDETAGPLLSIQTSTRAQCRLRATPATCPEKLWFDF